MHVFILTIVMLAAGTAAPAVAQAQQPLSASAWKIVKEKDDPLTNKPVRYAFNMPKGKPVLNGQPVTAILAIRCVAMFTSKPSEPEVVIFLSGLAGVGRTKQIQTQYRWDEGPVHSATLKATASTVRKGMRVFALPRLTSLAADLAPSRNPVAEIASANRMRVEVGFAGGGTVFLDFNVAGAGEAIRAVECQ